MRTHNVGVVVNVPRVDHVHVDREEIPQTRGEPPPDDGVRNMVTAAPDAIRDARNGQLRGRQGQEDQVNAVAAV